MIMKSFQIGITVLGSIAIAFAVWQYTLNNDRELLKVETGSIMWSLPGRIPHLGDPLIFRIPKRIVNFDTKVTYPSEVFTGEGFEIVFESSVASIGEYEDKKFTPTVDTQEAKKRLEGRYHAFTLDLPGLNYLPKEQNNLGVDGKVHWQVAPSNNPGLYKGYIRPGRTSVEDMKEHTIKWRNPGALHIEIKVKESLKILKKFEALLIGFFGSVMSFPAIYQLYNLIRKRKHN